MLATFAFTLLTVGSCPVPTHGLVAPVRGTVVERFVAPSCERCAGRRGIVVRVRSASAVLATASGEVTFAGQVGGALWVVQQVAPGVRVTYGRLAEVAERLAAGVVVPVGTPVGVTGETVYLGVRVGEQPRNPLRCWARASRLLAPNVGRSREPR